MGKKTVRKLRLGSYGSLVELHPDQLEALGLSTGDYVEVALEENRICIYSLRRK